MSQIQGVIAFNIKGGGYVKIPAENKADEKSITIPVQFTGSALPYDTVLISTFPEPNKWGETEGKVVKIIERNSSAFVGVITDIKADHITARPDNQKLHCSFSLSRAHPHKESATRDTPEVGDKILIHLDWNIEPKVTVTKTTNAEGYPRTEVSRTFYGHVEKIFGKHGEHNVEMEAIVVSAGFEIGHSPEVEADAARSVKEHGTLTPEELRTRRDVRNVWTCTIDPADAKDFDDALSYQVLPNGNVEIGIHIADVSHFVREGTLLDKEARKRAFSVYLVDRTIPMLPEILSNGMCSLNPNEDRFSFSAIFEMDAQARILNRWFGKTIIHSNKRFSYEEAQGVLDKEDTSVFPDLFSLRTYGRLLAADRKQKGAIDFESDEIKFTLDEKGVPISVYKKERQETNRLIEEFMLLANKEVAEFIFNKFVDGGKKLPGVYRVHDLPDSEKIAELEIFVNAIGLHFHPGKKIHARDIQKLLEQTSGHPAEATIKTSILRSMAKAAYKTVNIGHFGLAFEYYTNFTSPIRRYPDVCVHRITQKILTHEHPSQDFIASLGPICDSSSNQEVKAAEAERSSIRYKQVEYMSYRVGQEFTVTISGIADFGAFLQEPESLAEGLVRLKDLGDDFFQVDKKTFKIIGQNTNKVYSLGDKLRVKLRGVDLDLKTVDFEVLK
ncbi:MAG: hypothetical protein RJB39_199 [Candidatus Parcubacteria bacterium]|jgi:ribonuclease R